MNVPGLPRSTALALAPAVFHQKVIHSPARGVPEILIGSQNIHWISKLSAFPHHSQEYNGSSLCNEKRIFEGYSHDMHHSIEG